MVLLLKNVLFTVLVPGIVAVLIPYRIGSARSGTMLLWGVRRYAAVLSLSLGAVIYFRCVWDFAFTGGGTPAPIDAPKVLVVRGLYQYVRNPIYLGVLLIVLGWAMFFDSVAVVVYGVALAVVFHLFVVFVEEPRLHRKFGESYVRYRHAVPRWVPGKRYMSAA